MSCSIYTHERSSQMGVLGYRIRMRVGFESKKNAQGSCLMVSNGRKSSGGYASVEFDTNTRAQLRTISLSLFDYFQTLNPIPNIVAPSTTAKAHAVKTGVVAAADFLPFPRLMPKGRP